MMQERAIFERAISFIKKEKCFEMYHYVSMTNVKPI